MHVFAFPFDLSLSQPMSFPSFTFPFVSLISLVGELESGCLELSGWLGLNHKPEKGLSTPKKQGSKFWGFFLGYNPGILICFADPLINAQPMSKDHETKFIEAFKLVTNDCPKPCITYRAKNGT